MGSWNETDGGFRCDERKLRNAVRWWRRRAEFLQHTIVELRDGPSQDPAEIALRLHPDQP